MIEIGRTKDSVFMILKKGLGRRNPARLLRYALKSGKRDGDPLEEIGHFYEADDCLTRVGRIDGISVSEQGAAQLRDVCRPRRQKWVPGKRVGHARGGFELTGDDDASLKPN